MSISKKLVKNVSTVASAVLAVSLAAGAQAVVLSDGGLSVDIDNNGEFNVISLDGTAIDDSTFVQIQDHTINGNNFGGLSGGSAVTVLGNTASYSSTVSGFSVDVTSTILGALPSIGAGSMLFQQQFVYTNTSGQARTLASVSSIDQDLDGTGGSAAGDTVAFDTGTQSVFAVDAPIFWATISTGPGTLGWMVEVLDDDRFFPDLTNNLGPIGPDDTAMTIGRDVGLVGDGESVTLTWLYLFDTNGTVAVPADFGGSGSVPAPSILALLAIGLGGLGFKRRVAA